MDKKLQARHFFFFYVFHRCIHNYLSSCLTPQTPPRPLPSADDTPWPGIPPPQPGFPRPGIPRPGILRPDIPRPMLRSSGQRAFAGSIAGNTHLWPLRHAASLSGFGQQFQTKLLEWLSITSQRLELFHRIRALSKFPKPNSEISKKTVKRGPVTIDEFCWTSSKRCTAGYKDDSCAIDQG